MGYGDEEGSPGSVPEFGAIFMASYATKKESFRRKLLGLPGAQANFVKRVKAGMILFLFEFEKRELYGVYQASSDGAMNLVPHAFDSSGKQFPAQVPFTVIWYCKPLSEHEFQDAISENYYSHKKFNFGLSEDQVRRLLYLFSSRNSENRAPQRQFGGITSLTGKNRILGNEKVNKRNRLKFVEEGSPEYEGTISGRRKRVVEDSMDLMQENLDFNYDERTGYSLPVGHGDLRESLYNSRRLGKENQSLYRDTVKIENIKDALTRMNPGDFFTRSKRDLCDDIGQMREIREKHSESDYGLRSERVETFEIPQTELKRSNYDQSLFMDQKVDYDHSLVSGPKSFISKNQSDESYFIRDRRDLQRRNIKGDKHTPSDDGFWLGKGTLGFEIPQAELKRPVDDKSLFMDRKVDYVHNSVDGNQVPNYLTKLGRISDDYEQFRFGHFLENDITPVLYDRLDKGGRVADDDWRQIQAEQFSSRLDYEGKLTYQESNNNFDNGLGQVTPAVLSGHPLVRTKQLDNKHMLLMNDDVDNFYTMGNNELKIGYADVYQPGQQASIISSKPTLEGHCSLSQNRHKNFSIFPSSEEERMYATSYPTSFAMEKNIYGVSYPTSHDSVVTRSVPYNPDFSEVNGTPLSVKGLISQSDGSLPLSEFRMHDNQDPYKHYDPRVVESFLSGGYRENMGNPSITDEIYEDMSPFSSRIHDRQNIYPPSEFNEHTHAAEDTVSNKFPETVADTRSSDIQDLLIKYGTGGPCLGSSLEKLYDSDIDSFQDLKAMPTDSENRRTSVFARLSLSSKRRGQKEGYMEQNALDASVDQVMETVYESLSQKIAKANKRSLLDRRHNKEETLGAKKREKRSNQKPDDVAKMDDKPTMITQNMVLIGKPCTSVEENANDELKETRAVEFKRRSETNRRSGGKSTDYAQNPEGKREGEESKPPKRRKLIRPVFGKKEELNDNSRGDDVSNPARGEFLATTRLGNLKCQSPISQIHKKLVGPVFTEKGELNKHTNLQISSENKNANCDFSGISLENLNFLSPNSRKKLVRPSFGQKKWNEDSKRDGVLSTHDNSNNQKAGTCEFSGENLGHSNSASLNSGSLDSKAPTGSGKSRVTATNPKHQTSKPLKL